MRLVFLLVLSAAMQAGPLLPDQGIVGLIEPGEHNNWLLPSDLSNLTGITLQELLKQNPQNLFAFTAQTNSGPRNLIGHFPFAPWDAPTWTTPHVEWIPKDEPNFERFVPPVISPIVPPVQPPVHPSPCVGCEPVHPPNCSVDGTCHPHHPVPPDEPHHPGHEVPEPEAFYLIPIGLLFVLLGPIRRQ